LDYIRKLGFDPANIKYILISHGHNDHFAGAGRIKQVATRARVGVSATDWDFIATGKGLAECLPPCVPLTRDLVLNDNDVIKLGDTSVKVHATPGHSAGAVAFPHSPFLSNHSERSRQNGTGNVCFQQGRYCLKCTARSKNASTHEFSQYTADINLQL
jgi:L-ascorbate metabolism protein UlaG (beta-lactamase superfamily)